MANLTEAQLRTLIQGVGGGGAGRRPPTFSSGLPEEWTAFKITFENVAALKGWNGPGAEAADNKRRNLVAAFEGAAARAVQHIDPARNPANHNNPYTFNELMTAYNNVFMPAAASHLAMTQYSVAKQQEREAILSWHTRLRELFSRAFPGVAAQDSADLINKFILGLYHPVVRDRTWDAHPATYSEALEKATSKAAGVLVMQHSQGGRRDRTGHVASLGLGLDDLGSAANEGAAMVGAVGGPGGPGGRGGRRGAGDTCFNCGSPDHYKRDCPQLRQGPAGRGRGGRGGGRRGGRRDAGGRFTASAQTAQQISALVDVLQGLDLGNSGQGAGN